MPLDQLGPYKIERMIGRGGMGAVYAGVNEETGARAAIKVLSPTLADDPGFRERFKTEIETLKKLRHPNIVQLYGYGEHDGHLFYAMELVEGRNLQDEMQTGRRFTWREVCQIGIEICQALKHAHDVGVVHRDLKPANLLITRDGQIKLSDFGIAKLYGMSQLTADGGVLGTADYMAPEQADGRPTTTRCDMYSLGSVLFALLARRPPFAAPTLAEVLHALRYDEAPLVRRYAPDTPEELEAIIAELLDKEPQRRIATPLVLSNRLKAMLHALAHDRLGAEPRIEQSHDQSDASDEYEFRLREEPTPSRRQLAEQQTITPESPGASSESGLGRNPTRAMTAPGEPSRPPASPASTSPARHFTVVDNKASATSSAALPLEDDGWPAWVTVLALGLVVLLVGGLWWFYTLPPSADKLHQQIMVAVEDGDPATLANVEVQMNTFREHYPQDPRQGEVQSFLEELEIYRLQRRLEFRARRLRASESLLPVEQAYLDAMSQEQALPEVAASKLAAIVSVYGSDRQASRATERCVDLARRQLAHLRERMARSEAEHSKVLAARLREAANLLDDDPKTSRMICEGLVTLYQDKPWAAAAVEQARQILQSLDEQGSSSIAP
jgi:serine/threonine-protein kinase